MAIGEFYIQEKVTEFTGNQNSSVSSITMQQWNREYRILTEGQHKEVVFGVVWLV